MRAKQMVLKTDELQSLVATQKAYELGVVTLVELLNAEMLCSQAKYAQKQTRYRYLIAHAGLYQHSGKLDRQELEKLNGFFFRMMLLMYS